MKLFRLFSEVQTFVIILWGLNLAYLSNNIFAVTKQMTSIKEMSEEIVTKKDFIPKLRPYW
jgi:hypothetical protein